MRLVVAIAPRCGAPKVRRLHPTRIGTHAAPTPKGLVAAGPGRLIPDQARCSLVPNVPAIQYVGLILWEVPFVAARGWGRHRVLLPGGAEGRGSV